MDFMVTAALQSSDSKTGKSFALPAKFYIRNFGNVNQATLFFDGVSVSISDNHEQDRYRGS